MRVHGTLTKWNDERGFGFITPAKASGDIFVHISAFPRDGVRPRISELISFEVEPGPNGKQRAVRVMRPGQKRAAPSARSARSGNSNWGMGGYVLALLVAAALGFYGYTQYQQYQQRVAVASAPEPRAEVPVRLPPPPRQDLAPEPQTAAPLPAVPLPAVPPRPLSAPRENYGCDGRTMCSQMRSCAEATFFIRNCPNTQMDGDNDGVPCESQWCN